MKALEIARVSILRTFRDRMGLFFIVVLPMILVIVLGMTYGGMSAARVGIADQDHSSLSNGLIGDLQTTDIRLDIRHYDTAADLRDAVERGFVEIGLAIPAGYDAALRARQPAQVEIVAQPQSYASAVRTAVDGAVARQTGLIQAARYASSTTGVSFDAALSAAQARQSAVAGVSVTVESVSEVTSNPNGFAVGAESQVILFMFLTSMTGSAVVITTRQLGITRREFSTPTSVRTIIAGETLGRFVFALFQGGFIVVATALLFGVSWIDPFASGAIVVAFALVASGAAMLLATLVANEHQLSALGPALGMILGLLGGTMVPMEVFPDVMRTLSHATPHAWAMDAFHRLLLDGGGLVDVLPEVTVLLGFAAVLLTLAVFRFRRAITA
jgi:ABC-2 type transport system permease protein